MNKFTLYHGNVLDMLKLIPSDSVDFICCSPPYFSLRSYKIEPIVWGGKADCQHNWEEYIQPPRGGSGENSSVGANRETEANNRGHPTISNFCNKCGAWQGSLGLEPDYKLYLDHLLLVTSELKRVLKPTGSLYWNHGQTYFGGKGKSGASDEDDTENRFEEGDTLQKGYTEIGKDRPNTFPQGNFKPKCLMQIPERLAIRMVDEQGWVLRNTLVWKKGNSLPTSKKDGFMPTYEFIHFFVKNNEPHYWTNSTTGKAMDVKPLGINGIEGVDWEWRDYPKKDKEGNILEAIKKKRTLWWRWDYFFDLNSIRIKKRYPSQRMKDACEEIYWKAKEMRNQNKLLSYDGKVSVENAEMISSPRARQLRSNGGSIQEFLVAIRTVTHQYIVEHIELTQKEVDFLNEFQHNQSGSLEGSTPGDILQINTEALHEGHYAAFPTELPRYLMAASCPNEVCVKCGKPKISFLMKGKEGKNVYVAICSCNQGFRPAVAMDCFMGSGTTAVVAMERNLDVIGIELSSQYCRIIERRTNIKSKQKLGTWEYNLVERNTTQTDAQAFKSSESSKE